MYDIKQFRPALYTLLIMGFLGYGTASASMGLCLLAIVLTGLNAWLFLTSQLKLLPRLVANLITLLFAAFLAYRLRNLVGQPIFAIGEFLVLLQLVKLYELRANRDYAQLLILSLLLMIAAAISTGSLLFGILFIIYLVVSLYACLLFHLKTETDYAKAVIGLDEAKLNPATLKQDQKYLPQSMRRLTLLVSISAITMAAIIFVFFPRGSGAGILVNLSFKPSQALTGFSDEVSFQDVARISQNDAEVAQVTITRGGQPFGAYGDPIYLRGNTLDSYVSDSADPDHWKWMRLVDSPYGNVDATPDRSQELILNDSRTGDMTDQYQQVIQLSATGTTCIFAMPGVYSISFDKEVKLKGFSRDDEVLQTLMPVNGDLKYTAISTNKIGPIPDANNTIVPLGWPDNVGSYSGCNYSNSNKNYKRFEIPKEIRDFALRPEVSGPDDAAKHRLETGKVSDLDEQIARNIENYLQNNFTYTLDLTDAAVVKDKDPLVQFLYEYKKGHCEYFAGAMALMCQSLGIQARVVVGFKCDEFNSMGDYYQVRQSHAHAWVEAYTMNGWQRFDPTAIREAVSSNRTIGMWKRFMNFLDYLDYSWGNKIVNYDNDSRNSILQSMVNSIDNTSNSISNYFNSLQKKWLDLGKFDEVSGRLMVWIVYLGVLVIVIALAYYAIERIRLRRLARRIGLGDLPSEAQVRLARQLAFYDELIRRLERRNISRPTYLTQHEFSTSVGFLPNEVYQAIKRLTQIFYRVRFGGYELDTRQQSRLMRVVEKIDTDLDRIAI